MELDAKYAREPEPTQESGPVEMHIVKKYGKFHGHVKMGDGSEHHSAPMASMQEAHAAMAPHLSEQMDQHIGPED